MKDKRDRAVAAARADRRVEQRLQGRRSRLVGVDFVYEKVSDEGAPPEEARAPERAEVGIYDYERDALVVAVVDPATDSVLRVGERRGVQPPMTEEELDEARRLLFGSRQFHLAIPQLPANTSEADVELVAFPARAAFSVEHPWYGHRCFTLYLWTRGPNARMVGEAVVDLSAQAVLPQEATDFEIALSVSGGHVH